MSPSSSAMMPAPEHPALPTDTRLHGLWLGGAWAVWSVLTLLSVIDFVTSIAAYLAVVHTLCQAGACAAGQLSPDTARALRQIGISLPAHAALTVGLVSLVAFVYCAIAVVLIWRKPTDWMILLSSSLLVTQGLFEDNYLQGPFADSSSPWSSAGLALNYISPALFLLFCALFPNGRFVPRWLGLPLLGAILLELPLNLFPALPLAGIIDTLFILTVFPLVVGSMIYRYRRVSSPVERQQTKWAVFGITVVAISFFAWFLPQVFVPAFGPPGTGGPGTLYDLIGHPLFAFSTLVAPICIGIAILRYRLWDIDVLINRSLVYGSLTAILAGIYFACVLGAQAITEKVTGQTQPQPVIIVASTLLSAALFTPLRCRLQATIDRRFYRRKYDAARTLEAFSATLRSQLDLADLSAQLQGVVAETLHPAHVSLWLRPPDARQPSQTMSEQHGDLSPLG